MRNKSPDPRGLSLFHPPYQNCEALAVSWQPKPIMPGAALVWFLDPVSPLYAELDIVAKRPRSLPLFIVLPAPEDIPPLADILRKLPDFGPRGVVPKVGPATIPALRALLARPPQRLPFTVTDYLVDAGIIRAAETRRRIRTILACAPNVKSVDSLARKLCLSRRSIGRFFRDRDLPVPSHWLQFGRVLHVAVQLQNTNLNIGRVAGRFGYPDAFSLSNTMKRLTGFRPSFVRQHLGWEWIVETWLRGEGRT